MSNRPSPLRIRQHGCYTHAMPTAQDLARLRAETMLDARTIAKAYGGRPVTQAIRSALRKAAEALGLPPPPEPTARAGVGK